MKSELLNISKLKIILGVLFFVTLIIAGTMIEVPKRNPSLTHEVPANKTLWFINYNDNTIKYNHRAGISKLFSKLVSQASKGQEPLRILHIGDSHIQADFFTGETRRLLSEWFADENTARGYTFPYQIVGSNNPDDYEVLWKGIWKRDTNANHVGVAGLSISTIDSISELTLRLKPPYSSQRFDGLKIFFESEDQSITPFLKIDSQIILKEINSATYLLARPTDEATIAFNWPKSGRKQIRLFGIELINSKAMVQYHAAGVNGASVHSFLRSDNFLPQLVSINPHMVIISLGTNDSYDLNFCQETFKNNLLELVRKIKKGVSTSIIILSTPGDHAVNREHHNPFIEQAQGQIFDVANELGCGVWDFFHIMGGPGSINYWANEGLCAPDKLHLNRKGYKLQGALLFDALVRLTGSTPTLIIPKNFSIDE